VLAAQDQHPPQAKALTVQTLYFPQSHLLAAAVEAVMQAKPVVLVALAAAALIPGRVRRVLLLKALEAATLPETGMAVAAVLVK
jgi:hypothetical protein